MDQESQHNPELKSRKGMRVGNRVEHVDIEHILWWGPEFKLEPCKAWCPRSFLICFPQVTHFVVRLRPLLSYLLPRWSSGQVWPL